MNGDPMDTTWSAYLREIDQVRAIAPRLAETGFRAKPDDDDGDHIGVMEGHFSVFNRWYEIDSWFEGRFLERIAPGAFAKTIAEGRNTMRVLFEHGRDTQIGNKVLGAIDDVFEDNVGARYSVPLFDTSYNRDLLPGLKAGQYGASFRFRAIKDMWDDEPGRSDHNPEGIPERTVLECRVPEFGPCTFGANPGATAGVRSATDAFYEHLRSLDPQGYDDLLARAREVRTPDRPGAALGTPDDGSRTPSADEPPAGTRGPSQGEREAFFRALTLREG